MQFIILGGHPKGKAVYERPPLERYLTTSVLGLFVYATSLLVLPNAINTTRDAGDGRTRKTTRWRHLSALQSSPSEKRST